MTNYDPWGDDLEEGNAPLTKTQYRLAYIRINDGEYQETNVYLGEDGMSHFTEAQLFCDFHDIILVDLAPVASY